MKRLSPLVAVAGGAAALAIAGCGGTTRTVTVTERSTGSSIPTSLAGPTRPLSINQIYRNDAPGVVDITVTAQSSSGFPFGGSQETQGEGAGVIYDAKGDILTDEHVVAGATSVTVTFENGKKAGAKVLGTDPSTDVAVIKVNVPS